MPSQRNGFRQGRGRGATGSSRGGKNGPLRPKLPSALQEQIDAVLGGSSKRGPGGSTRKDMRKADRDQIRGSSRQSRRSNIQFPTQSNQQGKVNISNEQDTPDDETPYLPVASSSTLNSELYTARGSAIASNKTFNPPKKRKRLPELSLPRTTAAPDKEDEEIAWLEWMLKKKDGGRNGKIKPDENDLDDGLDDLLEFADAIGPGGKGLQESTAEEETFDISTSDSEEEVTDDDDVTDGDEELSQENSNAPTGNVLNHSPISKGKLPASPTTLSSIEPSTLSTKYVPPHMRAVMLEEKAKGSKEKLIELTKLERKAQGLLNKLSEANLESILAEAEQLYRDHSRNDVTTTITNIIIQMVSNKANLLDSFVVLYATLIGALHRVIGMEFGAHFLHTLVMKYNKLSSSSHEPLKTPIQGNIYETPDVSKEPLNLLVLISELYNAGVVSSKLLYDLIRGFLGEHSDDGGMSEKAVESLLKVLRCSGAQLRTDDPGSLKDIVTLVQDRTKGNEKNMTSRARFMIETLTNVKNGKIKATSGTEQGAAATGRMKSFLNSLAKKRRLLAHDALRVSLSDLLAAETKGKWWLVGAGWSGNPLVDRHERSLPSPLTTTKPKAVIEEEEVLLELAKKQGMNTDVRRSVFVVLMTSEDYAHACDRLGQFKLSEIQQREYVRVALHCCGLEKNYNPYYTLILSHLLQDSFSHRFTLQYALWDLLRELGETNVGGTQTNAGERFGGTEDDRQIGKQRIGNVARALAFIVARGGLDLTIFKTVDFTSLCANTVTFLTTFMIHTIISTQTGSPLFNLPKSYSLPKSFDEEPLKEIFEKTLSNLELAQGWLWIIESEMGGKARELGQGGKARRIIEELGEREKLVLRKGLAVARNVFGRAV